MNESHKEAMVVSIDLKDKLRQFDAHWSPKRVAGFNGYDIMVVKALGDFNWHVHEETDDFFLVLSGTLTVHLRDRNVQVEAGELYIVSAGVEHRTSAADEAHLLLIEPTGTPNTGDPSTAAVVEEI